MPYDIPDAPDIRCAERTGYPPRTTLSDLGYFPLFGGYEDDDWEEDGDVFYGNETASF